MKEILLAFIPIFVAIDCIGTLPIFLALTHDVKKKDRPKIILESMLTALCLAVGFIFLGKFIFKLLNVTVGDFMVAGGFVLFSIAIIDLINPGKQRVAAVEGVGAVPLGTPLIVGPGVLTTSLILIDQYGLYATLMAVLLNILLTGLVFSSADILIKILGENGSRALSKVTALFLTAIAVMMIRKGVILILNM